MLSKKNGANVPIINLHLVPNIAHKWNDKVKSWPEEFPSSHLRSWQGWHPQGPRQLEPEQQNHIWGRYMMCVSSKGQHQYNVWHKMSQMKKHLSSSKDLLDSNSNLGSNSIPGDQGDCSHITVEASVTVTLLIVIIDNLSIINQHVWCMILNIFQ